MKNMNLYKNISRVSIAMAVFGTALLSSCLKDTSPGAINFGDSPTVIGFQFYGFSGNFAQPLTEKVHATPGDTVDVKITLSTKSITLGSATTVNVALDPTDAATYVAEANAAATGSANNAGTAYTLLTPTVTIPAGQQYAEAKVLVNGAALDFTSTPVGAIKITGTSTGVIASNLNIAIMTFVLQSVFEGHYTNNGTFVDSENSSIVPGNIYPESIDLLTVSASQVEFDDLEFGDGAAHPIYSGTTLSEYGVFCPIFTLGGGAVTAVTNSYGQGTNSRARAAALGPGTNTYSGTPGQAGFKIQVSYYLVQAGVNRTLFTETYTYDGPAL